MAEQAKYTAKVKMHEAQREVAMRRRVYPRWVEAGRMNQANADRQIEVMQEIATDYEALAAKENPQGGFWE